MTKYKFTLEQVFYSVLAFIVSLAFWHLASVCYFADSEIWLLTLSQQTFGGTELTSILYKWTFHAITYLFSHFAPTEVDVYIWARTGWTLVALMTQLILAYTFSLFARNKNSFLPIFIAIMTFSAFFNQGFRIRGDILSLFAHSLILLLLFKRMTSHIQRTDYFILLLLNTTLVLSTPKSLYFFVAQFAFALTLCKNSLSPISFFKLIWITHLFPVVAILGLALLTHSMSLPIDLILPLHEATDYYLKSFDPSLFNPEFFSIVDFGHVIKAFAKSPIHAIIFFSGMVIYLFKSYYQTKNSFSSALNIYFGLLLLFIIFHNQKFPFFLGTFGAPLIAYSTALTLNFINDLLKKFARIPLMLQWGCMTLLCLHQYGHNLFFNNNLEQLAAIRTLDNYLTRHPKLRHYDIIGLLPRNTKYFLFIGPGEITRKKLIIQELKKQDPDIIIFTYKFVYLEPEIQDYLTKNRISIEHNVWVKGDFFSVTNNTEHFTKQIKVNESLYWLIPQKPKRFIYDYIRRKSIAKEVLFLDHDGVSTTFESASQLAVPHKYLNIVQTDIEPIHFFQRPYQLFRFDTNF